MKRPILLLLTAILLLSSSLPSSAQKYLPKTIQFKGDPEYSDQELLTAAGLKKGTVLTSAEMNEHSQRLLDSGLFESSSFTFNGVDLVFKLVPSTALYPVRLENLPLVPGKELDAQLHERLPLYHGKVPFEAGITDPVRQALEEMLAAKGIKATVVATPYTDQKLAQVTAMSFAIAAPPVRVGEISLQGVSQEMQAKIKPIAASVMKTDYSTENSVGNIERLFALTYANEGYAAVKVHAAQSGLPVADGDAIHIPFLVTVEEGRQYKLGTILLPSGEPLSLAEINKTAGAVSSSVEKMSIKGGVTLRTALLFLTGQYKSKGYMECVVTSHSHYDDANGIVNYALEVQTGPVYTMGKLTIENVADDLRTAMLSAWKLPTGSPFSEAAIHDYYASQGITALGRTFASSLCKFKMYTNIETHTVDVALHLERKP